MGQKGFANLVLIGGIIILLGLGGYFTWSKNSDWKTFINARYGFEVKYPENYFEFHKSGDSSISLRSEGCKTLLDGGGIYPLYCQTYGVLVQPQKIVAEGMDLSKTSVTVAGFNAEEITISEGMWDNMTQVFVQFEKDQNWYIQTFTFNQDKTKEAEPIIDQILSTFKFTK